MCLVLLYSCAAGVKSTAASLRLLSLRAIANRLVKYDTYAHRTNTLEWYIFLNKLPKGQVKTYPSTHTYMLSFSFSLKEGNGFLGGLPVDQHSCSKPRSCLKFSFVNFNPHEAIISDHLKLGGFQKLCPRQIHLKILRSCVVS